MILSRTPTVASFWRTPPELILMTSTPAGSGTITPWLQVMDVNGSGNLVRDDLEWHTRPAVHVGDYTDVLSEDLDGDGFAEVITARILPDSGRQAPILLECWRPVRGRPGYLAVGRQRNPADHEQVPGPGTPPCDPRHLLDEEATGDGAATDSSLVLKLFTVDHGFTEIGSQSMVRGGNWNVGFGDFNGDGLDDLLRCSLLFTRASRATIRSTWRPRNSTRRQGRSHGSLTC